MIRRGVVERVKKKEQIDVAIIAECRLERRSIYGIEIKVINQPFNLIRSDIQCLAEAISREDAVGKTSLKACFVTFIVRFDKNSDYVMEEILEKKIKRKDKNVKTKLIEPFIKRYVTLDFSLKRHQVDVSTMEEVAKYCPDEMIDDICYSIKAVFVYLITITRKETLKQKEHA